ncbi:MAG TPA: outer membrane beta-barrel protein, partial [Candidatus Polarisedimenticolaceae bacterium]|nr:outer membrane beta-barrel protein [Candidatus Polarisedimenticolaceae bacterium]
RAVFLEDDTFFNIIQDPRNDQGAVSDFGLEPQYVGTFSASYSFNPYWYLEGSVGYRRGDIGNVEVQAQFTGAEAPGTEDFAFRIFNLNGGTLTQVPLQLTTGLRFRPKAALNPYVCAGVGYTFNGFEPSDELNDLSAAMDNAIGGFSQLVAFSSTLLEPTSLSELSGITAEAPDAMEWHLGGGIEITFKRRWVVFADARYLVYDQRFALHMNGDSTELGISVPADQVKVTQPGFAGPFGPYLIPTGGLIDGGSLVPVVGADPNTNCATDPIACSFTGPPDGQLDPGFYYVHAGSVKYNGVTFQVGVKFTF